jgi:hypothetical protein
VVLHRDRAAVPRVLQVVDFEREGEMLRRGDTAGMTGLHLTTVQARVALATMSDVDSDSGSDSESGGDESKRREVGAVVRSSGGDGGERADGSPAVGPAGSGSDSDSDGEGGESGDGDGDGDGDGAGEARPAFVVRTSTKEERKAHKNEVKQLQREKRQEKIPKHIKKRKEKLRKSKK